MCWRVALAAAVALGGSGCGGPTRGEGAGATSAHQPPPHGSWRGANLRDCKQDKCGPLRMGMPNWTCEDGTQGGPVCKQLDGKCGWVVVDCPAAKPGTAGTAPPPHEQPPPAHGDGAAGGPPPSPDFAKPPSPSPSPPKRCGTLPDDATLKTWPVTVISPPACGPAHPPQPTLVKNLDDGTFIAQDRRRGCIRARYGRCKHTKCLPPDTRIATPAGDLPIRSLRVGMKVWTRDAGGNKVAGTILRTASVAVAKDHHVVRVTLADGRSVTASIGHPIASGEGVETLRAGMRIDGAEITNVETRDYRASRTYDILPSGPTGVYWANGIPLRSTLAK